MKRQVMKQFLVVAGLTLLFTVGVVAPLWAASPATSGAFQEAPEVGLRIAPQPPQVMAGEYVTLTAKVTHTGNVTATHLRLSVLIPSAAALDPTDQAVVWDIPMPSLVVTRTARVRVLDDAVDRLLFTATIDFDFIDPAGLTGTTTLTASDAVAVLAPAPVLDEPTTTLTPAPETEPPSPLETPLPPSPTATPSPTPTPLPPLPTLAPSPTPIPTPQPSILEQVREWLAENTLRAVLIFALMFLFALLIILILVLALRRRARPTPPPPSPLPSRAPLPPTPGFPCLEGVAPGVPRFDLSTGEATIGRAPENDVVISESTPGWQTVSRQHARIYRQEGLWIVEDLQSANGIYVNGRRTGLNRLYDGWRLGIGEVEFVFRAGTKEA
ncbi:MAG: FHA domain-containing protein [Anaerolineae bacterium]|nr:FHA domain-containing protein [Anaerolineae bacterium]